MIGTSLPEYIFIRICIIGLSLITPVSVTYCILHLISFIFFRTGVLKPSFLPDAPCPVEIWFAAETCFYLLFFLPYSSYLQRPAVHPTLGSRAERKELFEKCHETIPNPERYIRGWFKGAPLEEIGRDQVIIFFGWAFLGKDTFDDEESEELEEYVSGLESLIGRPFHPGNGKAKSIRLTLDPVPLQYRSLLWYCTVGVVDLSIFVRLPLSGFRFYRTSLLSTLHHLPLRPQALLTRHHSPARHVTYWHRPHTSKTHRPIVFLHGIGIGLHPYIPLLASINASVKGLAGDDGQPTDGQIGILAVEILPISSRLTHSALSRQQFVQEMTLILEKHEYLKDAGFVLVSHSYGTILSTHLIHSPIRSHIRGILLVDPVTFLLHMPDVAFNFTARVPKSANHHQLMYFAGRDVGVAHTLARRFFWAENVLWREEVGGNEGIMTTVSLGGKDIIVDAECVGRYLAGLDGSSEGEGDGSKNNKGEGDGNTNEVNGWKNKEWTGKGLEILWSENCDHAQVLERERKRRPLVRAMRRYSRIE
ncbi:hypothetical protein K402DRAFT_392447 [Aulographum hederae CBS 113979]|uniref:AB hydrolase-1 domain-containing protein n=1 Tax=Aulographum hederae CBS 113979 TaxID=1176131 RepID=A0A6G1H3U7_9PEZI|nr:hypothetical protein K402DRAFT_392447 [Aulographum hederae CBS 113979]